VEGEQWIGQLKPRIRVDLFLFYKEALVNICRHSGATQVSTNLLANSEEIRMIISDNGQGLSRSAIDRIPPALGRRAHLLGAHVDADIPPGGGCRITLRLNIGKLKILNWIRRAKPRLQGQT